MPTPMDVGAVDARNLKKDTGWGSKGSKGSDGKGKGKSKGKGKPKYGTCSVHDKQRLMDALSDDEQGGLCCKEDMECKSSAADRAKDKGRA